MIKLTWHDRNTVALVNFEGTEVFFTLCPSKQIKFHGYLGTRPTSEQMEDARTIIEICKVTIKTVGGPRC